MALMVTTLAMLISAFIGLRRSLQNRAKNRGDVYNELLLDILKRARKSTTDSELYDMKLELNEVLETAVQALDTDKITEEGFQSFAFLWQTTRDTVQERLNALTANSRLRLAPTSVLLGSLLLPNG